RQLEHVLHAPRADAARGDENERRARDRCDRREVLESVVGQALEHRRVGGVPVLRDHQRIAVGRALHQLLGGDHARGARAVLRHHRLLQICRKRFRQHAPDAIDAAARRGGDDQADGPVRILRLRCRSEDERQDCGQAQDETHRAQKRGRKRISASVAAVALMLGASLACRWTALCRAHVSPEPKRPAPSMMKRICSCGCGSGWYTASASSFRQAIRMLRSLKLPSSFQYTPGPFTSTHGRCAARKCTGSVMRGFGYSTGRPCWYSQIASYASWFMRPSGAAALRRNTPPSKSPKARSRSWPSNSSHWLM